MNAMSSDTDTDLPEPLGLDPVRQLVLKTIRQRRPKTSLKQASLALGRNQAYLHQYLYRQSPRRLPEEIRMRLADYLGIDESLLRQQDLPAEPRTSMHIACLAHPSLDARMIPPWLVPASLIEQHISIDATVSLLPVSDASMEPVLQPGDMTIIASTPDQPLTSGLYALDHGDHVAIRQLDSIAGRGKKRAIISCTAASHPSYTTAIEDLTLLGRVIWMGRMLF